MSDVFDPYHKWLGIPPADQPPNLYRLLGLSLFEDDPEVIQAAAERQMAHVRKYQLGQHSQTSQKILNEIAAAKICLLKPEQRSAYDSELRGELASQPTPPPIPVAEQAFSFGSHPEKSPPHPLQLALGADRWAGKALVAVGLVLVLAARSCTSLGDRSVARARAKVELFERQLDEELDESQLSEKAKELRAAADKEGLGHAETEGEIEASGDHDTFAFRAPASGRLQIDLMAPDGDLDGMLRVYNEDQDLIEENDDGGTGKDSRLVLDVLNGQRYFIDVSASASTSSSASNATGRYKLVLGIQKPGDDFENELDMAHQLTFESGAGDKGQFERWRALEIAARDAVHKNAMWAYWHEWLFLVGSICLVLGLLQIAFQAKGVEGWICLGMVAMILFSLYVGGVGWAGDVLEAKP
jgi:hypothetical protein